MEKLHWYQTVHQEGSKADPKKKKEAPGHQPGILTRFLADAVHWLDETAALMDDADPVEVYHAFRSVLHAIRDRMPHAELFQLSAQLPTLIRGILFDSYSYSQSPQKYHAETMLERVQVGLGAGSDILPRQAIGVVLTVLTRHVSRGEIDDMLAVMPADIRALMDECRQPYMS